MQAYLEALNLDPKADAVCGSYSGGNKRRLSVALSLIGSPRAIFCDEPSTGLDPSTRRKLWHFLQDKVSSGEGHMARSILLTTHSMEEADALCSNIAIMVNGSIRTVGTSQELKTRYSSGLAVIFSLGPETDQDGLKTLIKDLSKESLVVDETMTSLKFFVPHEGLTWSQIFGTIIEAQEELKYLDFSVSQRTLEDVFIEFANLQPGEDD